MGLKDLRDEIDEEVATLLGPDFDIEITSTQHVPHADDPAITFPNLDLATQGAKLIDTCVLYIDIRRSTELNFAHRAETVAKLYTAFVRAMTRVARHYGGHVRGIIGDRVMVIFDAEDCCTKSVNCAIAMNTVAQNLINKRFKRNEVECGIGIDAGNMLATKVGVVRRGQEQPNYRALVWLGIPANIASKLTDLANKPALTEDVSFVEVAYKQPPAPFSGSLLTALGTPPSPALPTNFGSLFAGPPTALPPPSPPVGFGSLLAGMVTPPPAPPANLGSILAALGSPASPPAIPTNPLAALLAEPPKPDWQWIRQSPTEFLRQVKVDYAPTRLSHQDPSFASFYLADETRVLRAKTPPILMTEKVWRKFRSANPDRTSVKDGLFKQVAVTTPGYTGKVFGGDVIFNELRY